MYLLLAPLQRKNELWVLTLILWNLPLSLGIHHLIRLIQVSSRYDGYCRRYIGKKTTSLEPRLVPSVCSCAINIESKGLKLDREVLLWAIKVHWTTQHLNTFASYILTNGPWAGWLLHSWSDRGETGLIRKVKFYWWPKYVVWDQTWPIEGGMSLGSSPIRTQVCL
jgi:hypothetical protein